MRLILVIYRQMEIRSSHKIITSLIVLSLLMYYIPRNNLQITHIKYTHTLWYSSPSTYSYLRNFILQFYFADTSVWKWIHKIHGSIEQTQCMARIRFAVFVSRRLGSYMTKIFIKITNSFSFGKKQQMTFHSADKRWHKRIVLLTWTRRQVYTKYILPVLSLLRCQFNAITVHLVLMLYGCPRRDCDDCLLNDNSAYRMQYLAGLHIDWLTYNANCISVHH